MSATHLIVWTFDRGVIRGEAECTAEPGADCRLTTTCECEEWVEIKRDPDGTPYHLVETYEDDDSIGEARHDMEPMDDCNVCLFLEDSDLEELYTGTFEVGRTPIKPVWVDGGYDWEPADEVTE